MATFIDLTGRTFGRWTVLRREGKKGTCAAWLCRCECGTKSVVAGARLTAGQSQSCGCLRSEATAAANAARSPNMTGRAFGRLTVLRAAEGCGSRGEKRWLCQCSCGRQHTTTGVELRKGRCRSCGCLRGVPAAWEVSQGEPRLIAAAGYRGWEVRNQPFAQNDPRLSEARVLWVNRVERVPNDPLLFSEAMARGMVWHVHLLVPTDAGGHWLSVFLDGDGSAGYFEQ